MFRILVQRVYNLLVQQIKAIIEFGHDFSKGNDFCFRFGIGIVCADLLVGRCGAPPVFVQGGIQRGCVLGDAWIERLLGDDLHQILCGAFQFGIGILYALNSTEYDGIAIVLDSEAGSADRVTTSSWRSILMPPRMLMRFESR